MLLLHTPTSPNANSVSPPWHGKTGRTTPSTIRRPRRSGRSPDSRICRGRLTRNSVAMEAQPAGSIVPITVRLVASARRRRERVGVRYCVPLEDPIGAAARRGAAPVYEAPSARVPNEHGVLPKLDAASRRSRRGRATPEFGTVVPAAPRRRRNDASVADRRQLLTFAARPTDTRTASRPTRTSACAASAARSTRPACSRQTT